MKIIAYLHSDLSIETPPSQDIWGLEIDRVYQDIGSRYLLNQLIQDCQQQAPDYLLIRRLEELGDNINIISDRLYLLESLDIEIITTEDDYCSSQFKKISDRDLKNKLTKILNKVQKNQQSIRLKKGHGRNRLKILPPPGKAPYGYRRGQDKYIIDKSTAPVVKDFFERFLLFGSLRGAVRYLEKRYGKKISPTTGKNWLTSPVYRGDLKYKNQDLISNTHTPIINREEAAQIDRLIQRNSSLAPRTASAPRSLAGLVSCQKCQLTMSIARVTQHHKKNEYLYLRCQKCPQKPKCRSISYDFVLDKVINKICLELPLAVAQIKSPNNSSIENSLKQKIVDKKDILNRLPSLLEENILDRETFAIRNYKIRAEISQLENKIAQLPPSNLKAIANAVSLPQFWLDLSEAERRFYFREFIQQIKITPNDSKTCELQLVFIF
ncbi:recombinase family protein [Waterburya agarophytonicola K14]|uniref:Recombinase family protein n=1 Tax=Waterburya agarophytonicola KI4 TaxID=2874699 RepID=A0A964BPS7_9CYAN|nr:recombinase family protein [Waterburya agarophytonicola KI4]